MKVFNSEVPIMANLIVSDLCLYCGSHQLGSVSYVFW